MEVIQKLPADDSKSLRDSDTSNSSKKSSKRKSFESQEHVETENLSSNVPAEDVSEVNAKKAKILQPLKAEGELHLLNQSSSAPAPAAATRSKSSLPRYQATAATRKQPSLQPVTPKTKAGTGREKTAALRGATIIDPSAAPSAVGASSSSSSSSSSSAVAAVVTSNTPPRSPRPNKQQLQAAACPPTTPRISNNQILRKFQNEVLSEVTGHYLTGLFENSFNFIDEKVTASMNQLKVKAKWDIKEKMRRQEVVVKELREIIGLIQEGLKGVKDSCHSFEGKVCKSLKETYDYLVDDAQMILSLKTNEKKLSKENENLANELKTVHKQLDVVKTEHHQILRKYETTMLLKEKENELVAQRNIDLESRLQKLTKDSELAQVEYRANMDKGEEVAKRYVNEISMLTNQINKLENDLEKISREQESSYKKNGSTHEELITVKAALREVEQTKENQIREIVRLHEEVRLLRETVGKKDDDIRHSMNSVYELQKQMMEEKNSLWHQLTTSTSKGKELEEERRDLVGQIASQKEEISLLMKDLEQLREVKVHMEATLASKEQEALGAKEWQVQLEIEKELRARCEMREESERRERIAATAQAMAIQNECARSLRESQEKTFEMEKNCKAEIEMLTKQLEAAHFDGKTAMDTTMGLRKEIEQLHLALQNAPSNHESVEQLGRAKGELEVLRQKLSSLTSNQEKQSQLDHGKMTDLEEKLKISEVARRKLHNMVQELRGNIRVFARVRPFLPGDGYDLTKEKMPDSSILTRADMNSLKISAVSTTGSNTGGQEEKKEEHEFQFDKVLGPSCTQEIIFNEVAEFVQSALDGYHVCLFSYGQTGSGKTHTMNGSGEGSMRGIIPRAMEQVGAYKRELQEKGWVYHMEVSFLEIYNETIRDLLRSGNSSHQAEGKHEIKRDAQGNYFVTELTKVPVEPEDFQQIMSIMEIAAQHRSTTATLMNDRSSRSHAVFTLHLKATNVQQGIELNGALNLVDLAGSERVDRSGVTGQELRETVAINKSLSALADVFSALANKQAHIPFRNSKLTYLLQPALSGDGKTLMIVNLSPTTVSFYESLSSLRFANQVSQCELGKPKRKLKDMGGSAITNALATAAAAQSESAAMDVVVTSAAATPAHPSTGASSTSITNSSVKKGSHTWDGVKLKGALEHITTTTTGSSSVAPTTNSARVGGHAKTTATASSSSSVSAATAKRTKSPNLTTGRAK